MSQTQNELNIW